MNESIKKLIEGGKWQPIELYDENKIYEYVLGQHQDNKWIRSVKKYGASGWYFSSVDKGYAQQRTEPPTHYRFYPDDRLATALELAVDFLEHMPEALENPKITVANLVEVSEYILKQIQAIAEATND